MNKNPNVYYNDAVPLNLWNMLFFMVKRWKSLITLLILGALLGVAIGNGIFRLNGENESVTVTEETVRNYSITNLTRVNMDKASLWRKFYAQQKEYNQNSLFMKMNANAVYVGELQYYVKAGEDTQLVGTVFENIMKDKEVIAQLIQVFDGAYEEKYVLELLKTWTDDPSEIKLESADGTDMNIMVPSVNDKGIVINYKVYGLGEDSCNLIMEVIRNKVQALNETFMQKYASYACSKVTDRVSVKRDTDVSDIQRDSANILCSYMNDIVAIENMFTSQEWEYYSLVYLNDPFTERTVSSPKPQNGRLAGAGILTGLALWILYWLIKYLTDRHIKYAEEIQERFGLAVVGRYRDEEKILHTVDMWEERVTAKKSSFCVNEAYIISALSLLDGPIFLSGGLQYKDVEKLLQNATENIENSGYGDFIQCDNVSLEKAKRAGSIVLFVKKGKTTYAELKKELEICRIQGIRIAGSVLVE